jgi:periplasmic divalent cation tolerance protein
MAVGMAAAGGTVVVVTTLKTVSQARRLVRRLVADRLIACGTILPGARSVYRWQARVVEEHEVVVLLKTTGRRWRALKAVVAAEHPYEVPELLALPVRAGLGPYLAWVREETR